MRYTLEPIGVVRKGLPRAEEGRPRQHETHDVEGRVEIFPKFVEGLDRIEGFSHLFLLTYLNQGHPDAKGLLKIRPRRHMKPGQRLEDLPLLGVFATDAPVRPNPIGLTLVEFVGRQGNVLVVKGIDIYEGTPVVDIKPYRKDYRAERHAVPAWVQEVDPERESL